jgi:hypothetical protein
VVRVPLSSGGCRAGQEINKGSSTEFGFIVASCGPQFALAMDNRLEGKGKCRNDDNVCCLVLLL